MSDKINIIFFGDLVGRPGRHIVRDFLELLQKDEKQVSDAFGIAKPDFVIANVENASHGFGLTEKNHNELKEYGIDCFTSGNHIWDKKDIFNYIDESDRLIRPLNYPNKTTRGVGSRVFQVGNCKVGVINLLGRTFMNPIDSPWEVIEGEIAKLKEQTPIIIVDFHAEATAEKISFGYYVDELGVSAVLGTHTHVQTADEKILKNGCAYITDAGFCGAAEGVIGMDYTASLKRLVTSLPERFDVAPMDAVELNAVSITINKVSGKATEIKRFKYEKNYSEVNI